MSREAKRQLTLGVFLTRHGHYPSAWRQPGSAKGGDPDFAYWASLVKTAERGKLDTAFFADFVGMGGAETRGIERRAAFLDFEPTVLVGALAPVTQRIGLVATVNALFNEPYNVARRFAALDHITGGRVGWNVVSSLGEGAASSFGLDPKFPHEARYEKAAEFIDVTKKLWDSWRDGAFDHADPKTGIYLDKNAVHPIHHRGKYYKLDAILDAPRPIQGYPVFVQAGNSDTGREFAAKYAEMIYASAQFLEDAQAYYADVKGRMAKYGRHPDHLKITPGLSFVIGRTEAEAREKHHALEQAVDFSGPINLMGHDVSEYPLDGPLPELPPPDVGKGRWEQLTRLARRENLTIRQLYLRFNAVRGHRVLVGTPTYIAEQIQHWFDNRAADGFNLIPPVLPSSLEDFVDLVVPQLQERGIFRADYTGKTFRENLGLPRPPNQFE
jgi:alkanesulfonate monooxygenase